METPHHSCRAAGLVMLSLVGIVLSGCGGSSAEANPPQPSETAGTGVLTVTVTDPDGRPVMDARVSVFNRPQTAFFGGARTDSNGSAI